MTFGRLSIMHILFHFFLIVFFSCFRVSKNVFFLAFRFSKFRFRRRGIASDWRKLTREVCLGLDESFFGRRYAAGGPPRKFETFWCWKHWEWLQKLIKHFGPKKTRSPMSAKKSRAKNAAKNMVAKHKESLLKWGQNFFSRPLLGHVSTDVKGRRKLTYGGLPREKKRHFFLTSLKYDP